MLKEHIERQGKENIEEKQTERKSRKQKNKLSDSRISYL